MNWSVSRRRTSRGAASPTGLAGPRSLPRPPAPAHGGIEGITAARIARHIGVLADDSLLGRATPSRGLDAAAAYVAAEFRRAGLQPARGRDLVVRWPLVTTHVVTSGIELAAGDARASRLVYGTDFGVMRAGAARLTAGSSPSVT